MVPSELRYAADTEKAHLGFCFGEEKDPACRSEKGPDAAVVWANNIGGAAVEALLYEVGVTPKPGLVDRANSGSHKDMNYSTFVASALALREYFVSCAELGYRWAPRKTDLFPLLQQKGIAAEKKMYEASHGVNTHKGAIFSLGLLSAGAGILARMGRPLIGEAVCLVGGRLAQEHLAAHPWNSSDTATNGERAFAQYGVRGIRGEAGNGFPSVRDNALPVFKKLVSQGKSLNEAGAVCLLHLIAAVEDTNMIKRGGYDTWRVMQQQVREILNSPEVSLAKISDLDRCFIQRNLSPGGCADLLAVTFFLWTVERRSTEWLRPETPSLAPRPFTCGKYRFSAAPKTVDQIWSVSAGM